MPVPWLLYLGAIAQLAPLAAAVFVRPAISGPRTWVLVWCALLVTVDGASFVLGRAGASNLVLFHLLTPVGGALALWALSYWQDGRLPRLALRLTIVPFILAWTVLTYLVEDISTFGRVAKPLASLLCLSAASFTLLARSRRAEAPLQHCDWFWISGGMAVYFGSASALAPLSSLLLSKAPDLLIHAYEIKSVLDVFAFLAIARGVTCPAVT